jgi:hypothetical protein
MPDPNEQWDWTAEDIEQAANVYKRLLGIKDWPKTKYKRVYAVENLSIADVVSSDALSPNDLTQRQKI